MCTANLTNNTMHSWQHPGGPMCKTKQSNNKLRIDNIVHDNKQEICEKENSMEKKWIEKSK